AEDGIRDFSRDWSSDVCSSDLAISLNRWLLVEVIRNIVSIPLSGLFSFSIFLVFFSIWLRTSSSSSLLIFRSLSLFNSCLAYSRSEERRVGKECRYRW